MSYRVDQIQRIICDRLNDYGYGYVENRMYPKLYQTYLSVRKVIALRLGYAEKRLDLAVMEDDKLFELIKRELDVVLPAKRK